MYVRKYITWRLWKKIYIGKTGRRDWRTTFANIYETKKRNDTDACKPDAHHFNLSNHSHHNLSICGLSLHHGNTESNKNLEQKFSFQLGTLSPHGINERLSPRIYSQIHVTIFLPMEKLLYTLIQTYNTPQFLYALRDATPILTKYQGDL